MRYRYFYKPHAFSTYTTEKSPCSLCGETHAGYKGPFYGEAHVGFVCEECLAAGKLRDLGASANEGDVGSLREQLRSSVSRLQRNPNSGFWSGSAQQNWSTGPLTLLPGRISRGRPIVETIAASSRKWACRTYDTLASDGDGRRFFEDHLHGDHRRGTDLDNWWQGIRPDSPEDNAVAYNVGVYLFQCTVCPRYVIMWDAS